MVATQLFFIFIPKIGEMIQFWLIFFKWVGSTTNQLSVVDPTRFAKEVKEKCGVKAKAVPREKKLRVVGLGPQWPVLVWFEDQLRIWRLREVIPSSTKSVKLPAICSMFSLLVSFRLNVSKSEELWLTFLSLSWLNKTTNYLPGDPLVFSPSDYSDQTAG